MKKYIHLIFLLIILQTFYSCDKSFLDEKVYSSYSPTTLTDSLGFEASEIGLQKQLLYLFTNTRQGWLALWQVGTDIAYSGAVEGVEAPYFNYGTLTSTDEAAGYVWSWAYQMINNTNIIIKNVENPALTGMSQNNKDQLNGEARFFRAYAYNILATCYGKVPVITEPLSGPKTNFVRDPIDVVNQQIETDLLYAATHLPFIDEVKKNSGGKPMYARPNKAMAQQLLAEAYLRMGQPAKAEEQCNAIIASTKFSLTTTRFGVKASQPGDPFSDMFIAGNERRGAGNNEVIWTVEMEYPALVNGGITNDPQGRRVWGARYVNIAGLAICDSLGGRGICRIRLNNWVNYKLYERQDMRNSRFIFRRRYVYNDPAYPALYGKPVPYSGPDTVISINPSTRKWACYDPNDDFGFDCVKDIIMMRFGETYLLLAEAQFKQGKLDAAAASINVIRNRANATPIVAADVTLNFILDERVRELVGEENRRLTLMRTGTLVERANRLNQDASSINMLNNLTDKNLLFPIPQSEIDLNKDAVLEQNPGY